MSKFRSPGKWKPDGITRTNTGGSIRGKIGPPIPIPDDDEFPIRTPGTGIATPLGTGSVEKTPGLRGSTATDRSIQQTGIGAGDFADRTQSASIPAQSSTEEPLRRTTQPSALRISTASIPSGASVEKPQRKKSSLRSVFGRLFGKKRKGGSTSSNEKDQSPNGLRADQHRSVSALCLMIHMATNPWRIQLPSIEPPKAQLVPKSVLLPYLSTSTIELCDLIRLS